MTPRDAASILPRKYVEGEVQAVKDNGSFSMYALVFGNVDRQGDIIDPGSVYNVDELVKDGWVAYAHENDRLPVAWITAAEQDRKGLRVEGKFHSTAKAQEIRTIIRERLEAGKAVKTSIGYHVPSGGESYERVKGSTVRRISKLAVYEASFVNLPANPQAEVMSAKSVSATTEELMDTKSGRKVSRANLDKMRGFLKVLDEHSSHGETIQKARRTAIAEFGKFLDDFEPEDDNDTTVKADAGQTDNEALRVQLKRRSLQLRRSDVP